MIDEKTNPSASPSYWSEAKSPGAWQGNDSALRRFLGGAPLAVLVKLVVLSLVTGAILVWLDIRPAAIFRMLTNFVNHLYLLGFEGLREFGTYIGAGAAIVIPVWLVLRILSYRPAR